MARRRNSTSPVTGIVGRSQDAARNLHLSLALAGGLVMLAPLTGQAQETSPDARTPLGSLGGNNLQQASGDTVQTACGKMIPINDQLTGNSRKLFERCRELVQTGNDITGVGGNDFSLGLSQSELQDALQRVAPEETEAMGAGQTDTSQDQLASLASRLQFLRTGTTTLPIAGVYWSGEDWAGGAAGDDDFSRLGAFLSGVYGTGDKRDGDPTNGVEDAFEFDAYGLTAGVDYRIGNGLVLGIGVGYIESEVEFERNYGENETEGWSYLGYGTWYADNFFIEGSIVYGNYDYDMSRNVSYADNTGGPDINQKLSSDTEGDSISWNLGLGYNINIENSNITFTAQARGLDADIDGYAETGGELAMELDDQEVESLQSVLGVQAAFNFNRDFGVLVPYGSLHWHHEFEDDARDIRARYVFDPFKDDPVNTMVFTTDPGDEDYFRLSLGANFVLTHGTQVFFNYDTLLGLEGVDSQAFTVGLRLSL
jgi:outer membrane autotransporter protein